MFSPLEQFDALRLISITFQRDYSLFNTVLPLMVLIALFIFIMNLLMHNLRIVPTAFQRLWEIMIEFVFNLIKQQIGREGYIYFPFIYTLFNFVLITNLIGLIPFGIALTSHIVFTMGLSLSICLSIFIIGLYRHNVQFLKIFIPESPFLLLPLLIAIEIFSYIIRAASLAIRLTANIMAGHTLVFILSSSILSLTRIKIYFFLLGFIFLVAILFLELGVAFLQAYVFTVLTSIYLNDAIHGGAH